MPPIVEAFTLEYTWSGEYDGRPWANVMHALWLTGTSPRPVTDLDVAAGVARDAWDTNIGPVVTNEVLLTNVRVQDLNSLEGQVVNLEANVAGDGTGPGFPGNVAALVTKRTVHSRTQRNGRWFQVGLFEANTDSGTPSLLNASAISVLNTAFAGFQDDMSVALAGFDHTPVVLSKASSSADDFEPKVITSFSVQPRLATQRRRLRG